jgi:hypothetical protein
VGEDELEGVEPARLWSFFSASLSDVSGGCAMPATVNVYLENAHTHHHQSSFKRENFNKWESPRVYETASKWT